ncbi:MAG: hypothetical protein ACFB9M_01140 [Myxococcota bacterium]
MERWFETGAIVDVALVILVGEGIAWAVSRRFACLPNLTAGAGLLLALRAALTDAHWGRVAAAMTLALLAHGFDMWSKWRGSSAP